MNRVSDISEKMEEIKEKGHRRGTEGEMQTYSGQLARNELRGCALHSVYDASAPSIICSHAVNPTGYGTDPQRLRDINGLIGTLMIH